MPPLSRHPERRLRPFRRTRSAAGTWIGSEAGIRTGIRRGACGAARPRGNGSPQVAPASDTIATAASRRRPSPSNGVAARLAPPLSFSSLVRSERPRLFLCALLWLSRVVAGPEPNGWQRWCRAEAESRRRAGELRQDRAEPAPGEGCVRGFRLSPCGGGAHRCARGTAGLGPERYVGPLGRRERSSSVRAVRGNGSAPRRGSVVLPVKPAAAVRAVPKRSVAWGCRAAVLTCELSKQSPPGSNGFVR